MTDKKEKKHFTKATSALVEASNQPLPDTFTDRQRQIFQFVMRGFTQTAIAKALEVSQPYIAAELRRMREKMAKQARDLDQEVFIGETLNVYEQVKYKGWELYQNNKDTNPNVAAKALDTIMSAQERSLKVLTDVGIIQKAKQEHEHTVKVAPFMENFEKMDDTAKRKALNNIIDVQLSDLAEPEPPMLVEGEIEDDDDMATEE